MKHKISVFILSMACALGISFPVVADAQWGGKGYRQCRWVGGHWRNGVWRPARKVCTRSYRPRSGYRRCRWIPAHWRNGQWHPARRVCVRRW